MQTQHDHVSPAALNSPNTQIRSALAPETVSFAVLIYSMKAALQVRDYMTFIAASSTALSQIMYPVAR